MERIKISNFRRSKDTWDLDLASITFITGRNNSGKSTILKALLLLEDYAKSNNHFELNFNGPNSKKHKIDSFDNAVNWFSEGDDKNISFGFVNGKYSVDIEFVAIQQKGKTLSNGKLKKLKITDLSEDISIRIEYNAFNIYQAFIDSSFLESRDLSSQLELDNYKQALQGLEEKLQNKQLQINSLKNKKLSLIDEAYLKLRSEFELIADKIKIYASKIKNLEEKNKSKNKGSYQPKINLDNFVTGNLSLDRVISDVLSQYLKDNENSLGIFNSKSDLLRTSKVGSEVVNALRFNIEHLSPQRNSQTRMYINDNRSNDINLLINLHSKNPIRKNNSAGLFIKKWMKKFDIGEDYNIRNIEGLASIIEINYQGRTINLVDKGFGAGQIFAVILRIAISINSLSNKKNKTINKTTIVIEEPEANLHPEFQSYIADMLYDAQDSFSLKFIIETHSEYILRRSQLLVNKHNNINPESIHVTDPTVKHNIFAVYYFDTDQGPYNMEYREDGKFSRKFGKGFFDVADSLSMEMYKENLKK